MSQGVGRIGNVERKVITAAEFERMSPAEQDQIFAGSVVKDLSQVPPVFLARVRERVAARISSGEKSPKA